METSKIETLLLAYAAAIDSSDAAAAGKFLDPEFRVLLNNYKNSGTASSLSRQQYLDMVREGKAGGTKRVATFLLIDIQENAALVKLRLEGEKTVFTNYYSLVRRNSQWYIVNDIPQLVNKSPG